VAVRLPAVIVVRPTAASRPSSKTDARTRREGLVAGLRARVREALRRYGGSASDARFHRKLGHRPGAPRENFTHVHAPQRLIVERPEVELQVGEVVGVVHSVYSSNVFPLMTWRTDPTGMSKLLRMWKTCCTASRPSPFTAVDSYATGGRIAPARAVAGQAVEAEPCPKPLSV